MWPLVTPAEWAPTLLLWTVSLLTRQLLHKWKISSPAVRVLGMSLLTPSCQWNLLSSGTAAVRRISHADAELVWPNHAPSRLWKCTGEGVLSRSAVCCSPWPCGLKSARFLCPWDFFCKNTGVGYHFPPPRDLLDMGIRPASPVSPSLYEDSSPTEPREKPTGEGNHL